MSDPRRIPDDWESAARHGSPIYGMFPCKTPLQSLAVRPEHAWTTEHAIAACVRECGMPPVTAIDLTAGSGYYARTGRPWGSALYVVIPCRGEGRDDAPPDDAWERFYLAVRRTRTEHPDAPIVVHCTHGMNRTGYMICKYAVVSGLASNTREALAAFAAARPWGSEWGSGGGIYKSGYVTSLLVSAGDPPLKEALPWPAGRAARRVIDSLPDVWRIPFGNGPVPRAMPAALRRRPSAAHDVGETVRWSLRVSEFDAAASCACIVRSVIAEACNCSADVFAGPQPVAMRRVHLSRIGDGHAVTWKGDGCRLLIVVLEFGTYGLNRRMEVRRIGDPMRALTAAARSAACPIVLDSEVIVSRGQTTIWAHDLMAACGVRVSHRPFRRRIEECARVLRALRRATPPESRDPASIKILRKGWWPASQTAHVLSDPRNADRDGLIFAPYNGQFVVGVDHSLLKWKLHNTVDFLVSESGSLLLMDGLPVDDGEFLLNMEDRWKGCVIEAAWNYDQSGWVAMFSRADKPRANNRETYLDTKNAIAERVTEADVLNAVDVNSYLT